ncbi:MAG: type II toxin-antitoxin system VapC family toxin [Candidatus Babeliaceae bacterium]|nr:type II toxin-antitoxin system VapC family toxin [Candidatus Babeliaceae bacterium]
MAIKSKIYLETTVISYFTARPSRDIVVAGRQETTREKWSHIVQDYEPYISALVLQEARQGDPDAAQKRLEAIRDFPVLDMTTSAQALAAQLLARHGIPTAYPEDALHIAVATMNAMDVLLTWNFTHINNLFMRAHIRRIIEEEGYQCPEICSPDEL